MCVSRVTEPSRCTATCAEAVGSLRVPDLVVAVVLITFV